MAETKNKNDKKNTIIAEKKYSNRFSKGFTSITDNLSKIEL